jgi:hypothetical protein
MSPNTNLAEVIVTCGASTPAFFCRLPDTALTLSVMLAVRLERGSFPQPAERKVQAAPTISIEKSCFMNKSPKKGSFLLLQFSGRNECKGVLWLLLHAGQPLSCTLVIVATFFVLGRLTLFLQTSCLVCIIFVKHHHDIFSAKSITPILHCRVKTIIPWVSAIKGKSGFDFYMCKIKV